MNTTRNKQIRLAEHYLRQLRKANRMYKQGGVHVKHSISIVEREWEQIKQLQNWAFEQRYNDQQAAVLCSAYPQVAGELLDLILSLQEQRGWREAGLAMARQIDDRIAEITHLLALARIHEKLDAYPVALEYTQQALVLAHKLHRDDMIAQVSLMMGILKKDLGNYRDATLELQEGLRIFRSYDQAEGITKCLIERGEIANFRGLYEQALNDYTEAMHLYRQIDDTRGIAASLRGLASTLYNQGDYATAKHYRGEAWQISTQIGDRWNIADIMIESGGRTLGQESLHEARQYCEESLQIYRQIGSLRGYAHSLMKLATIASIEQQHTSARDYCDEALQIYRQIGNRYGLANSLILMGYIHQGLGDTTVAQRNFIETLTLTLEMDAAILIPQILAGMSNQLLLTGHAERGAMFYGLAAASPWLEAHLKDFAFPVLYHWLEQSLDADTLAAAVERGKQLNLDETLKAILSEWR